MNHLFELSLLVFFNMNNDAVYQLIFLFYEDLID